MNIAAHLLVFLGAFFGPERNPAQAVPWYDKVGALLRLAQTGKEADCEKILAAIRAKKQQSEQSLSKGQRARTQIEEGIRFKEQHLFRPGWDTPDLLRDIDSRKHTLLVIHRQDVWDLKMLEGRKREECAFIHLCDTIKVLRRIRQ